MVEELSKGDKMIVTIIRWFLLVFVSAFIVISHLACSQSTGKREHAEHSETSVHNHGESATETSDLDKPLQELFSADCEHAMKTYECAECRYEVGVVKVPADLIKEGLVQLSQVTRQSSLTSLTLTGEVNFDEDRITRMYLHTSAVVRQVLVKPNENVHKGTALITLEGIEMGEAQGEYLEALAILKLNQTNYERSQTLHQRNLLSEFDYQQAQHDFETYQIKHNVAFNKLIRMGMDSLDITQLQTSSGKFVVRSPRAGKVLAVHTYSGQSPALNETIVILGDETQMWVWADLDERDVPRLTEMQKSQPIRAEITLKSRFNRQYKGEVSWINAQVNHATRKVQVCIRVDNRDGELMAGMFVDATLFLPSKEQSLAVKKSAVLEDENRTFVFIRYREDYFVRRPVTLGAKQLDWVEVVDGLQEHQEIVADGSFLLKSDVLRSKMGAGCAD